jgi:hypothetical protein
MSTTETTTPAMFSTVPRVVSGDICSTQRGVEGTHACVTAMDTRVRDLVESVDPAHGIKGMVAGTACLIEVWSEDDGERVSISTDVGGHLLVIAPTPGATLRAAIECALTRGLPRTWPTFATWSQEVSFVRMG